MALGLNHPRERLRVKSTGFVRRWHDEAVVLIDHDDVAGRELSAATCLECAVDGDIAILDRELRLAAAIDNAGALEELIERDRSRV